LGDKLITEIGEQVLAHVVRTIAGFQQKPSVWRDRRAGATPNPGPSCAGLEERSLTLVAAQVDGVNTGCHSVAALRRSRVNHVAGCVEAPRFGECGKHLEWRPNIFTVDEVERM
jgi:hypothetical protein